MTALYEDIVRTVAGNLKCPICFEIFTDPATLCCGHSYCLKCINAFVKREANCPQCREEIHVDLKLRKNVILCNILELNEAGGRRRWEIIANDDHEGCSFSKQKLSSEAESKVDSLLKRLDFLKSEIRKTEDVLSTELNAEQNCKELEDTADSLAQNEKADILALNNKTSPAGIIESQSCDSIAHLPQDLSLSPATVPEAAGTNGCQFVIRNSEIAPDAEFALLTFSPRLGHKRLAFHQARRKVEVRPVRASGQPDRFDISQWMAEQEFTEGIHYWDVDTAGSKGWAVGVAYLDLDRRNRLGRTSSSWCVEWSRGRLSFWHDNKEEPLKHDCPEYVRLVLDLVNGSLSFYSLSNGLTLLYNVQVDFSAPLRPMFWLYGLQTNNALSFPISRS